MDAPTQYPSAVPEPIAPIPGSVASGDDKPPTGEGKLSRHLHGHVPLSPGGTKLSGAVYLSDSHRAMLQALVFRMTEGGTWIAITGPAQIGKTILVQAALTLLPQDKLRLFQVRHFGPGPLSLKSVLSQILDTAETDTVTSRDLDRANESLFLSSARGGHAVLLIDDAQDLAADALRYLLALASHPEAAKLHLQVVLVGRPDLWTTLQHQEFKPLRDKLALRLTLDRLRPGEDHSYVERRLWVVGTSIRKAITQPALQEIVRFGAGVPGNIDQLLDQAAELRRQRGESRITVRTARAAVAMLSGAEPTRGYQSLWMAGAGIFLVFACAIAFYVLLTPVFQSGGPFSPAPPPTAPSPTTPTASPPPAQAAANTTPPAPAAASAPADSKPAPAPPEGAAGPTKLADTNLAALDGNQPPSLQAKPDQAAGTAEALAGSQHQPTPEAVPEPPSQQQPAGEKAAAAPPVQESPKAPVVQQSSEPGAPTPTEPEAKKNPTSPPPGPPAQQQSAEPAQPVEPAPAEQSAAAPLTPEPASKAPATKAPATKAEEQTRDQPEPVPQEAAPSASPAGSAQPDQKPVELAASRPMPAPPPDQPAPTPQSDATIPPSASQKLSADIIAALIRRGDAMLATGDISAARLLYRPAAEAGSGSAAAALGRTFDPAFLASSGVIGIQPDPEAAAKWYRKAASLGEPGMEDAIKRLEVVPAAANSSGGR